MQAAESLENALHRFKRKVQQEDVVQEVKRHPLYLKPGENKRSERSAGPQTQPQETTQRAGIML